MYLNEFASKKEALQIFSANSDDFVPIAENKELSFLTPRKFVMGKALGTSLIERSVAGYGN